eukprot:tig00020825_g14284.t1
MLVRGFPNDGKNPETKKPLEKYIGKFESQEEAEHAEACYLLAGVGNENFLAACNKWGSRQFKSKFGNARALAELMREPWYSKIFAGGSCAGRIPRDRLGGGGPGGGWTQADEALFNESWGALHEQLLPILRDQFAGKLEGHDKVSSNSGVEPENEVRSGGEDVDVDVDGRERRAPADPDSEAPAPAPAVAVAIAGGEALAMGAGSGSSAGAPASGSGRGRDIDHGQQPSSPTFNVHGARSRPRHAPQAPSSSSGRLRAATVAGEKRPAPATQDPSASAPADRHSKRAGTCEPRAEPEPAASKSPAAVAAGSGPAGAGVSSSSRAAGAAPAPASTAAGPSVGDKIKLASTVTDNKTNITLTFVGLAKWPPPPSGGPPPPEDVIELVLQPSTTMGDVLRQASDALGDPAVPPVVIAASLVFESLRISCSPYISIVKKS